MSAWPKGTISGSAARRTFPDPSCRKIRIASSRDWTYRKYEKFENKETESQAKRAWRKIENPVVSPTREARSVLLLQRTSTQQAGWRCRVWPYGVIPSIITKYFADLPKLCRLQNRKRWRDKRGMGAGCLRIASYQSTCIFFIFFPFHRWWCAPGIIYFVFRQQVATVDYIVNCEFSRKQAFRDSVANSQWPWYVDACPLSASLLPLEGSSVKAD